MQVKALLTETEVAAVLRYLQEFSSGAAQAPPHAPPGEGEGPQDGRALVARNGCQGCHVIEGVGGQIGPHLDTLFQRRDMEYVLRKLVDPTFDNPNSVMPRFPLTDEQRQAIVEYLATVNRR
jgi:mono/diheme cytochrome c family protein